MFMARDTRHLVSRRALLSAAGLGLYVIVGAAISTHVVAGSPWVQTADNAAQLERLSVATVVVGVTVEDVDCDLNCEDSFSVLCTTTKDHISADWILVRAADFDPVYRALRCAEAVSTRHAACISWCEQGSGTRRQ